VSTRKSVFDVMSLGVGYIIDKNTSRGDAAGFAPFYVNRTDNKAYDLSHSGYSSWDLQYPPR
jgi:hypothetical protein